jgi:hypothetical protein
MQRLVSEAQMQYASASNDAVISAVHATLIIQVSELERQQSASFFAIAPGAADSGTDRWPAPRRVQTKSTHCARRSGMNRASPSP